jgi:FixJ family two-component response regulator
MEKQRTIVAIVDDDPGMRDSLQDLISIFGYRTEAYSSAEEFVRAATTTGASCIVIDIQLGDTSGIELARHLSATGFTFPVIFMTGSLEERHRRQALDFGCVAYLHKPFPAVQLINAITKAIGCAPGQDGEECQNGVW